MHRSLGKWMIKANAYTFEKEIPTFLKKLEKPVDVMDAFSFEKEAVICKGIVENLDEYTIPWLYRQTVKKGHLVS